MSPPYSSRYKDISPDALRTPTATMDTQTVPSSTSPAPHQDVPSPTDSTFNSTAVFCIHDLVSMIGGRLYCGFGSKCQADFGRINFDLFMQASARRTYFTGIS